MILNPEHTTLQGVCWFSMNLSLISLAYRLFAASVGPAT